MRRWLLALVALAIGIGLALALVVQNLDALLDAQRDRIAERAEAVLGRKVEFGRVRVSLGAALAIRVEDLRIADDPDFSKEAFLGADSLRVRLKLLPALRGEGAIDEVSLDAPSIGVIGTSRGLSPASLGRRPGAGA